MTKLPSQEFVNTGGGGGGRESEYFGMKCADSELNAFKYNPNIYQKKSILYCIKPLASFSGSVVLKKFIVFL